MQKLQSVLSDEESMNQIRELAGMLSQGSDRAAAPDAPPPAPDAPDMPDIAKLMQASSLIKTAAQGDKNVDLLLALRPLLREENQVKIDRLIKIFKLMKIYPALKDSGLLGGDLFGIL